MSLFTTAIAKIPKSNVFRKNYEWHATANFGALFPCFRQKLNPGETLRFASEMSIKLAPMKAPAMSRIDATVHYFFVPMRLLYDHFQEFITGDTTGTSPNGELNNPVAPCFDFQELYDEGKLVQGSLQDYMNLPTFSGAGSVFNDLPPIDATPWLAYKKIYSDWYRDELLDTDEFEIVSDGKIAKTDPEFADLTALRYRCWHKDYFTSARPDTQLGPEQSIPVSGSIVGNGTLALQYQNAITQSQSISLNYIDQEQLDSGNYMAPLQAGTSRPLTYADGLSLEEAGILINDLRRTLKTQEWQEKNMRGGNRYIESMFNHFGVKSSDARLQRSQYIAGKKIPVVIGEILQSVNTAANNDYGAGAAYLGQRGGVANAGGQSGRMHYYAEEHGWVIGLLSIMPHASYYQGIPRELGVSWDRFQWLWPEFGNLGEMPVYNWELYVGAGSGAKNGETFGYQSQYAHEKCGINEIHGEFRTSLAFWHNARVFTSRPNLNVGFVRFTDNVLAEGQNRIFAVESNALAAHFYCHFFHHVKVLRKLPKFGVPSI